MAVFNRPERLSPCKVTVRAPSVPATHHMRHVYQLASPVALFHLAVDQAWFHLPPAHGAPSLTYLEPLTKVGSDHIEVEIEPVTGEERQTAGSQELSQGVDEQVRRMLCARTQSEHRQNLGEGIDGQPQPEHLGGAAQPGTQFIQLNVWEQEVAEIVLVQRLSMLSSASKPGDDGGLTGAKDPLSCGSVQSFGQRREHHSDLAGRGFQTVQWRVAPRALNVVWHA